MYVANIKKNFVENLNFPGISSLLKNITIGIFMNHPFKDSDKIKKDADY